MARLIVRTGKPRFTAAYDGDRHKVSQTDVLGNATTFQYDGDGREIATIEPLGNRATTVIVRLAGAFRSYSLAFLLSVRSRSRVSTMRSE